MDSSMVVGKRMSPRLSIPALRDIAESAGKILLRFPLPLAAALFTTLMTLFRIHNYDFDHDRLLMTAMLSFFLLLAVQLFSEGRRLTWPFVLALALAGIACLAFLVNTLPQNSWLIFLAPCLVLLVTTTPFLTREATNEAFWEFNHTAWLSAAFGGLAALIVSLGLWAALYAIEVLFPIDIPMEPYQSIGILAFGLLWPCLALAGVPSNFTTASMEIPWGLELLAGKILIPLIAIFLAILYAYLARIVILRQLPDGQVATMVSLYASLGVLTYLLVYPLRDGRSFLIRFYQRWFFPALIPVLGLLAVALQRRISDYGMTEDRYFVGLLGLWLALSALIFIISRRAQLKILPLLLACLLLLASFGPWGAVALSARSQLSQLETLLERNGLLTEGKIHPTSGAVDWDDTKRITSILRYFSRSGIEGHLIAWFEAHDHEVEETPSPSRIASSLGLELVERWQDANSFSFYAPKSNVFTVNGFQYLVRFNIADIGRVETPKMNEQRDHTLTFDKETNSLIVSANDGSDLVFPLRPTIDQHLQDPKNSALPETILQQKSETHFARLHIEHLQGSLENGALNLEACTGILLVGWTH